MVLDTYLTALVGVAGAVLTSQLPGFTLQYMQNLNGRLDELEPIVLEFEADVNQYNYTLEEALVECETAQGLFDALCDSFEGIVMRYEDLLEHYDELDRANGYTRPFVLFRTHHHDISHSVMEKFEPTVPTSAHGLVYAGCGFLGATLVLSIFFFLLKALCCRCCSRSKERGKSVPNSNEEWDSSTISFQSPRGDFPRTSFLPTIDEERAQHG